MITYIKLANRTFKIIQAQKILPYNKTLETMSKYLIYSASWSIINKFSNYVYSEFLEHLSLALKVSKRCWFLVS